MDPDATLAEIRLLSQRILDRTSVSEGTYDADAQRLAYEIRSLDEWLSKGSFFPREWRPF